MGAARSATALRNRLFRRSRSVAVFAQRRSRWRGSPCRTPRRASGTAEDSAVKSPPMESQSQVPSVTTDRMWFADLVSIQRVISLLTQCECAEDGEARRTNHSLSSSARSMADHRFGSVDNPVSSRKIRRALRLFQGLARSCRPRWSAGASCPSAAWL